MFFILARRQPILAPLQQGDALAGGGCLDGGKVLRFVVAGLDVDVEKSISPTSPNCSSTGLCIRNTRSS